MSQLTDTQLVILSAAAAREDGAVLPLPQSIKAKGGALANVIDSMINRGLIYECKAAPNDQSWREEAGDRMTLRITNTGRMVIGANEPAVTESPEASPEPGGTSSDDGNAGSANKQAALLALLEREEGATIAEMMEATDWQGHSVRGAISGTVKKKLGLPVTSEKIEGRGRVYRIVRNHHP